MNKNVTTTTTTETSFDFLNRKLQELQLQANAAATEGKEFKIKEATISLLIKQAIEANCLSVLATSIFSSCFFVEGESNLHFAAEKRLEQLQKSEKSYKVVYVLENGNHIVELGIDQQGKPCGFQYSKNNLEKISRFDIEHKVSYNFALGDSPKQYAKEVKLATLANLQFARKELQKIGFQVL